MRVYGCLLVSVYVYVCMYVRACVCVFVCKLRVLDACACHSLCVFVCLRVFLCVCACLRACVCVRHIHFAAGGGGVESVVPTDKTTRRVAVGSIGDLSLHPGMKLSHALILAVGGSLTFTASNFHML